MQHTSKTDAQVCVKNYNSDANNKDVITVDYLVTGGRQKDSIWKKSLSTFNILFPVNPFSLWGVVNCNKIYRSLQIHTEKEQVSINILQMNTRVSNRFLTIVFVSCQTWILASTWHVSIIACAKRLDQMMLAALLLTVVHPTKNQSVHQMAQHTTTSVCFDRKCVFSDWISLCNTLVVVKVGNCWTLKFLTILMKMMMITMNKPG